MNQTNTLKPIPNKISKELIEKMYPSLSTTEVRSTLKGIVQSSIEKNPFSKRTINCQNITTSEFIEFVSYCGKPKGYEFTQELNDSLQLFEQRKTLRYTSIIIEKCVTAIRKKVIGIKSLEEKIAIAELEAVKHDLNPSFIVKICGFGSDDEQI